MGLSDDGKHSEDLTMAETKKKKKMHVGLPAKTYWHLYSLQSLQADKLIRTVNKVLRREYSLIK